MAEYAERDILKQGNYYMRHVAAMTAEGLHNKSDIAAELAHRDMEIARLKAAIHCERESGTCFAVHHPDREPCTADNCNYMQPNTGNKPRADGTSA